MPSLPRFLAPATGSAGSGLARANASALADTGGVTRARALTGLGRDVQRTALMGAQVIAERQELDASLQRDTVTVNMKDFISKQRLEIDNSTVISTDQQLKMMKGYGKDYDDFFKDQLKGLSPLAIRKLNAWNAQAKPQHNDYTRRSISARWRDFQVAERLDIINSQVAAGDAEGALATVAKMEAGGLKSHEWAAKMRGRIAGEIEKANKANAISLVESQLIATADAEGWDAAINRLSGPTNLKILQEAGLSLADAKKTLNNLEAFGTAQAKLAEERVTKAQDDKTADLTLRISRASLPVDEGGDPTQTVTPSELNADLENNEITLSQHTSLMRSITTDVSLNYPEYDKVISIIDGVARETHTEQQAKDAINNGVGKFFDTTVATSLRTKLSTNAKAGSPTKRPAHTRAITAIEEVYDAMISANKDRLDYDFAAQSRHLQQKARFKNDLDAWILKNPESTDEQIEKKVEAMLGGIKQEAVQGMLSKLFTIWKGTPFGVLYRKAFEKEKLPEPTTQAEWEEEVARLKTIDPKKARGYYDKWAGKW